MGFDWEKPCTTVDGRAVLNLTPAKYAGRDALMGVVDGCVRCWWLDGSHVNNGHGLDLVNVASDASPNRVMTRDGREVRDLRRINNGSEYVWAGTITSRRGHQLDLSWTETGEWRAYEEGRDDEDIVSSLPGQPHEDTHAVAEALSETPREGDPYGKTYKADFETAILAAIKR